MTITWKSALYWGIAWTIGSLVAELIAPGSDGSGDRWFGGVWMLVSLAIVTQLRDSKKEKV